MKIINLKKEFEEKIIKETCNTLGRGGMVICPTETCYIPAVDATNPEAVEKLLKYKGERRKPISVAVCDQKMAQDYVEINEIAENLYKNFLPGPVTVVSKSKGKVISSLESATHALGIRIPDYPLVLTIIRAFGKPITSTSANTSGKKTPYSLNDILKYTSKKRLKLIDLFLDAGQLPVRPTSTVVDTTLNEPTVLRQGEIVIPDIPSQTFVSNSEEQTKLIAQEILEKYKNLLISKPLIFALQGELGSGKTQFAKGLGQALKITSNIPSPTFIFFREYPYKIASNQGIFYHIDTWRMENGSELLDLGFKKMLGPTNIIAIEWLQKVKPILEEISQKTKVCLVWVTIKILSETKRRIKYQI